MKTPKQIADDVLTMAQSWVDGRNVVALKPSPESGRLLLASGANDLTLAAAREVLAGIIDAAVMAEREACFNAARDAIYAKIEGPANTLAWDAVAGAIRDRP